MRRKKIRRKSFYVENLLDIDWLFHLHSRCFWNVMVQQLAYECVAYQRVSKGSFYFSTGCPKISIVFIMRNKISISIPMQRESQVSNQKRRFYTSFPEELTVGLLATLSQMWAAWNLISVSSEAWQTPLSMEAWPLATRAPWPLSMEAWPLAARAPWPLSSEAWPLAPPQDGN